MNKSTKKNLEIGKKQQDIFNTINMVDDSDCIIIITVITNITVIVIVWVGIMLSDFISLLCAVVIGLHFL